MNTNDNISHGQKNIINTTDFFYTVNEIERTSSQKQTYVLKPTFHKNSHKKLWPVNT